MINFIKIYLFFRENFFFCVIFFIFSIESPFSFGGILSENNKNSLMHNESVSAAIRDAAVKISSEISSKKIISTPTALEKFTDDPMEWLTLCLAVATCLLWLETARLRKVSVTQSEDAKASIAIAKDALKAAFIANEMGRDLAIADRRPWLSLSVSAYESIRWNENSVEIPLSFLINNLGRSPALNVSVVAYFTAGSEDSEFVKKINERLDSDFIARKNSPEGYLIFPGENKVEHIILSGAPQYIEEYFQWIKNKNKTIDINFFSASLIGSVFYNMSGFEEIFETRFHRSVMRVHPFQGNLTTLLRGEDVLKDSIVLMDLPFTSGNVAK